VNLVVRFAVRSTLAIAIAWLFLPGSTRAEGVAAGGACARTEQRELCAAGACTDESGKARSRFSPEDVGSGDASDDIADAPDAPDFAGPGTCADPSVGGGSPRTVNVVASAPPQSPPTPVSNASPPAAPSTHPAPAPPSPPAPTVTPAPPPVPTPAPPAPPVAAAPPPAPPAAPPAPTPTTPPLPPPAPPAVPAPPTPPPPPVVVEPPPAPVLPPGVPQP
jgi:hypothetical protein